MSIIHRDYLEPTQPVAFPPQLALLTAAELGLEADHVAGVLAGPFAKTPPAIKPWETNSGRDQERRVAISLLG